MTTISYEADYTGLSTGVKPVGVPVGKTYRETDTNLRFVYTGSIWLLSISNYFLSNETNLNLPVTTVRPISTLMATDPDAVHSYPVSGEHKITSIRVDTNHKLVATYD